MIYYCVDCRKEFYKLEPYHKGHEVEVEFEEED